MITAAGGGTDFSLCLPNKPAAQNPAYTPVRHFSIFCWILAVASFAERSRLSVTLPIRQVASICDAAVSRAHDSGSDSAQGKAVPEYDGSPLYCGLVLIVYRCRIASRLPLAYVEPSRAFLLTRRPVRDSGEI